MSDESHVCDNYARAVAELEKAQNRIALLEAQLVSAREEAELVLLAMLPLDGVESATKCSGAALPVAQRLVQRGLAVLASSDRWNDYFARTPAGSRVIAAPQQPSRAEPGGGER